MLHDLTFLTSETTFRPSSTISVNAPLINVNYSQIFSSNFTSQCHLFTLFIFPIYFTILSRLLLSFVTCHLSPKNNWLSHGLKWYPVKKLPYQLFLICISSWMQRPFMVHSHLLNPIGHEKFIMNTFIHHHEFSFCMENGVAGMLVKRKLTSLCELYNVDIKWFTIDATTLFP